MRLAEIGFGGDGGSVLITEAGGRFTSGIVLNAIEVDPGSIPDWAADWPELPDDAGIGWSWDGAVFAPPPGPSAEELLAAAKAAALAQLDAAIRAARTAMITDMPGQDMIYLAKEAEARAWAAAEAPDLSGFPLLAAETGITAPDPDSLAQVWLNMADLWRSAAAQLEALRMSVGAAIDLAETPEEVAAAMTTINKETI